MEETNQKQNQKDKEAMNKVILHPIVKQRRMEALENIRINERKQK